MILFRNWYTLSIPSYQSVLTWRRAMQSNPYHSAMCCGGDLGCAFLTANRLISGFGMYSITGMHHELPSNFCLFPGAKLQASVWFNGSPNTLNSLKHQEIYVWKKRINKRVCQEVMPLSKKTTPEKAFIKNIWIP